MKGTICTLPARAPSLSRHFYECIYAIYICNIYGRLRGLMGFSLTFTFVYIAV